MFLPEFRVHTTSLFKKIDLLKAVLNVAEYLHAVHQFTNLKSVSWFLVVSFMAIIFGVNAIQFNV